MRILFAICLVFLSLFFSCTGSETAKNLEKREQELLTKEKDFAAKEADFNQLIAMRDSLKNTEVDADIEAIELLPQSILGTWNGKMVCTESNCPDNVIGDQRNDLWEFTAENLKITSKSGGERLFKGVVSGSEIKFVAEDSIAVTKKTEIFFNLADLQNNRLKGSREITGKNNCIAKFTVDLEKTKN